MPYIIVKHHKDTKLNQLYDATVQSADDQKIRVTGDHRLAGNWLKQIQQAVKDSGRNGTHSVFYYTNRDEFSAMIDPRIQTYLKIKGFTWQPIAIIDKTRDELKQISEVADDMVERDLTHIADELNTRRSRLRGQIDIIQFNRDVKDFKDARKQIGSRAFQAHIQYLKEAK